MKKYIPYIIIGVLLLALVFQYNDNNTAVSELKKQNTELEKESELLLEEADSLSKINKRLQSKSDSLDLEIKNAKEKILIIQTKRNEKVISIDRYTLLELQKFFAERYK